MIGRGFASMSTRGNPTKRRLRVAALACLGVATLGPSAAAEEKFHKLTGGQIRTKLAGMELTDNVHWRDFYQRNGTVMSTSMGRKRTGKWLVEDDQLCIEFEKEPIRHVTTCGSPENRSSCGAKVCCRCRASSSRRADATSSKPSGAFACCMNSISGKHPQHIPFGRKNCRRV